MLDLILDIASWILLCSGVVVCIISAIGMLRMPSLYTRVHAASVTDTLGAFLILFGCMLQVPDYVTVWTDWIIVVKLIFIMLLLIFLGPVSVHALAQAAIRHGIEPDCETIKMPSDLVRSEIAEPMAETATQEQN